MYVSCRGKMVRIKKDPRVELGRKGEAYDKEEMK
jgi:hypothetical protein